MLWLLQTVFLQSFYDAMLVRNTRGAAAKIAACSEAENLTDVIDRVSLDNSLLIFVTDTEGTILCSSDSYKSYYRSFDNNSAAENPYRQNGTLGWQVGSYRNLPDGYEDFLIALKADADGETEIKSDTRYIYGTWIELNDSSIAALYVSTALGTVGPAASIIRIQLLWVTMLSLLLSFIIARFLAEKFSAPVDQLSVQARMLAADSYESIFERGFCSELDGLADSLDETARKLTDAKKYRDEILANVSHDLRTPLTMIKGYAEMLRDISWEDEAARNEDAGIIIREADRLTALVNEILAYTKLRGDTCNQKNFTGVDLSALLRNVIFRFEPLFHEKVCIEHDIEDGCVVTGDAKLLESMAYNLIDNALRHTGSSGRISVSLRQADAILLEVRDYGSGITQEELPYIWEKYYTARQRGNTGVSGLGLAIVKRTAEIHGGTCGVESTEGEGSRFWVILKRR